MKFSVITPCYNDDFYLKTCINSVKRQKSERYFVEHIIQNAGNSKGDNLNEDNYSLQIYNEKDEGMYDGINRGIRKALANNYDDNSKKIDTKHIISYLSADEQYNKGAFQEIFAVCEKIKNFDVLLANTIFTDEQGKYLYHKKTHRPDYLTSFWNVPASAPCSWFINSTVFSDKKHYFDSKWKTIGDKIWLLSACKLNFKFHLLDFFTSIFIVRKNNLGSSKLFYDEVHNFENDCSFFLKIFKLPLLFFVKTKKLFYGAYFQKAFSYETINPKNQKVEKIVVKKPNSKTKLISNAG